jgi:radical SAM PhpK family P-methyltransferase
MIDCLIIGFNDFNFQEHEQMVRSMGTESGAYRDLNLAFIEYEGKPYRSMDILNRFYFEDKPALKQFSNVDFLWPVVLYLGTYLHRRGFTFDYVNLFHLEKEKLKEKLTHNEILTVAITTTLYVTAHPILEIISFIRQHNEKVKIVVGGPYIHNQTKMVDQLNLQQQLKYIGADYYVISQEGEAALVNLLNALKQGTSLERVENIAYRDGNGYVVTATSIESNALEENMVDYRLFPKEDISEFISLRTAKSCPFSCAFCGFPQRAGKYKYITVELVEQELNTLADLGVSTVTFLDDTFNVPKGRFREMLEMMIRNKYGFKWNSFYRSDHGDRETIELMAKAGCEGVFLGVESGSDEMLTRMNKTSRRRNYMEAIPIMQEVGISAHANVIVGFPGETYETVKDTVSLIEEAKPDFFRAQLWYADPMTPIWNHRDEYGVQGSSFHWSHNTMDYLTACDLIERIFLSVENSIWMPQSGFEQWSTFYLQRKGMTRHQLKTFMRCFNAAVKDKLINPSKKGLDPKLLDSLKASCQFDKPALPDAGPVEIRSARRYNAAEKFWTSEFSDAIPFSNLDTLRERRNEGEDAQEALNCMIEPGIIDRMRGIGQQGLGHVILAAYGALLSRLSGREEAVIVTAAAGRGEGGVVPLKLQVSWDLSFRSFVEQVAKKIEHAAEHNLYSAPILTNPWRMALHGAAPPIFDVGYWHGSGRENSSPARIHESLRLSPEPEQGVSLALQVADRPGDTRLTFSYQKRFFSPDTIERLAYYLESLFKEVGDNPDIALGDITLGSESGVSNVAVTIDAAEEFNF